MKRTKLRRKSKSDIRKIQDELWQLCRKITFNDYSNECYTCGKKNLIGRDLQCGHFIPSSIAGAYLRYDLRNLRPQCAKCNISEGGNGAEFYRKMLIREGATFVDELMKDRNKSVKAMEHYQMLLEKYKKL